MRLQDVLGVCWVAALASIARAQGDDPPPPDPTDNPDPCVILPFLCTPPTPPPEPMFQVYNDDLTNFTFGQYDAKMLDEDRVYYRIAIPDTAKTAPYDTVVQILSPNTISWSGLAWGGTMLDNPLTVVWPNCSNVVISSRWAVDRSIPKPYAGATYEILPYGTFVNESHWQVTFKCTGCSAWNSSHGAVAIDPNSEAYNFAFATGRIPVVESSSNMSAFSVHDVYGRWEHNFTVTRNKDFAGLVQKNRVAPPAVVPDPGGAVPATATCAFDWIPPPGAIIVTTKTTQTVTATNAPAVITTRVTQTAVVTSNITQVVSACTATRTPAAVTSRVTVSACTATRTAPTVTSRTTQTVSACTATKTP